MRCQGNCKQIEENNPNVKCGSCPFITTEEHEHREEIKRLQNQIAGMWILVAVVLYVGSGLVAYRYGHWMLLPMILLATSVALYGAWRYS